MQLEVFKYEGAGNDFLLIDNRSSSFPDGIERAGFVRHWCDRRRGIGADGVLLLEPPETPGAHFRMVYYNSDGGEASMCGNGARCIAAFAVRIGAAPSEMAFDTRAGIYRACVMPGEIVSVAFPTVNQRPRPRVVHAEGHDWSGDFLLCGVPHFVVWVKDAAAIDVARIGRALRFHPESGPEGANVNFAQVVDDDAEGNTVLAPAPDGGAPMVVPRILLRTYERGVEAETLACGTGAVATALCHAARMGLAGDRILMVIPTSGDLLEIRARIHAEGFDSPELIGPARYVFQTTIAPAASELG